MLSAQSKIVREMLGLKYGKVAPSETKEDYTTVTTKMTGIKKGRRHEIAADNKVDMFNRRKLRRITSQIQAH